MVTILFFEIKFNESGRFISPDPAEQGMNLYIYAGNNPTTMIDPSGLAYRSVYAGSFDMATALSNMYAKMNIFWAEWFSNRWADYMWETSKQGIAFIPRIFFGFIWAFEFLWVTLDSIGVGQDSVVITSEQSINIGYTSGGGQPGNVVQDNIDPIAPEVPEITQDIDINKPEIDLPEPRANISGFDDSDLFTLVSEEDLKIQGVWHSGGTQEKIKEYESLYDPEFWFKDLSILIAVFGLNGTSPIKEKDWKDLKGSIVKGGMFNNVIDTSARAGIAHSAIDLAIDPGTFVYATTGGKVIFSGWRGPYGNSVIIEYKFGNTIIRTYYNHLSEINYSAINSSDGTIKNGTKIGEVGNTTSFYSKDFTMGYHLDYQISINGQFINPAFTLPKFIQNSFPVKKVSIYDLIPVMENRR